MKYCSRDSSNDHLKDMNICDNKTQNSIQMEENKAVVYVTRKSQGLHWQEAECMK